MHVFQQHVLQLPIIARISLQSSLFPFSEARCENLLTERPRLNDYGIENKIAEFEDTVRLPSPMNNISSKYNLKVYSTKIKNTDIKTPESTAEKMDILNNIDYDVVELLAKNGKGKATIYYGQETSKGVRVSYSVFDFKEIMPPIGMVYDICDESHPVKPISFAGNLFNLLNLFSFYEPIKKWEFFKLPYPTPSPKPGILRVLQSGEMEEIYIYSVYEILGKKGFTRVCSENIGELLQGRAVIFVNNKSKVKESKLLAEAVASAMEYFTGRKGIEFLVTDAECLNLNIKLGNSPSVHVFKKGEIAYENRVPPVDFKKDSIKPHGRMIGRFFQMHL